MVKQVVIFDFDGTLANSISLAIRLYNEHAEHFKALPISEDDLPDLRRLVKEVGYAKTLKTKHIRLSRMPAMVLTISREMRQHMAEVKPYPGIVEALQELKARGFRLGVLTSNQEHLVREFLETHQYPMFDFIVSEKTLFGKDKALKKIMKKFSLERAEVVYVGDEPRDIVASRKADVAVIGVTWGLAGVEGLGKTPPDILVHDASELVEAVQSL